MSEWSYRFLESSLLAPRTFSLDFPIPYFFSAITDRGTSAKKRKESERERIVAQRSAAQQRGRSAVLFGAVRSGSGTLRRSRKKVKRDLLPLFLNLQCARASGSMDVLRVYDMRMRERGLGE